jgi:hypothetical protein
VLFSAPTMITINDPPVMVAATLQPFCFMRFHSAFS